jgi:hypothetical protein
MQAKVLSAKCAICGDPAVEAVRIDIGEQTLVKDLCEQHLGQLTEGTRPGKAPHLRLVEQGGSIP